ncbi:MAG: DUF1801 domain-containing protein [Flavobacteriales bacterium]|nr:DUF1801 domain-containing protein [Flavobacteriales bacterium]
MSQNKTQPTKLSVEEFLGNITPEQKQKDCRSLVELMKKVSGHDPVMWGNIIGFDQYHYKYDSGREGDFFKIGFAPRAKNIAVYAAAYNDDLDEKKKQLGKIKLGKSCIYINKLEQVNEELLGEILKESIEIIEKRYPTE